MKLLNYFWTLGVRKSEEMQYPLGGIAVVAVLLFLTPLLSAWLAYLAFGVCIYRVIRYDARSFATDYCILITLSQLFRTTSGMSFLVYLCLLAGVWYFIRDGIRPDSTSVLILVTLNYLLWRMEWNISDFLLCFGQLFLLYVLLPKQDSLSAERTAKLYCVSLFVSSLYALLLRNTWQMQALRGSEVPAYWGSSWMRFQGLFEDPNFYMLLLVVGLALLLKLKDCGRIHPLFFWIMGIGFLGCGILTFSKTFFLSFLLLLGICIVWQFWNKRVLRGVFVTIAILLLVAVLLFAENSPFAVVLERLANASDLSDLTTGRTDVFTMYFKSITETPITTLFGHGFVAPSLGKDPHNLFLEVIFYIGIVGLMMIIGLFTTLVRTVGKKCNTGHKHNLIAKYVVLFMATVIWFALHGMFSVVTYGVFMLAFVSMLFVPKKEAI